ncbi:hypothetical protein [Streptomyces sp. NPDC006971]|uniref:hypothetical protein n=1 Tax=Streptomyces sp. NPDC006971 TaxID=3154784 RepID=UPI0033DD5B7D
MPRLAALLVPLVLLTASACMSVPAADRPAAPPAAPAPAAAAYTPSSAPLPSQAPAREELVRTDDGKRRSSAAPPERARQAPADRVHRPVRPVRPTARPGAVVPQRPRTARPAPAAPRRPAAAPPRKKPQRTRPDTAPAYDMRTLCRSAARNGVGQNIVDLCRSTYGR